MGDMLHCFVYVYLDNMLIFSSYWKEHVRHVCQVFQRFLQHRLFVKPEKCAFHVSRVAFLGYIISQGSLEMDAKKVEAVRDWPLPMSVKQIQRFLVFANFYRRFISNFGSVAAPLTALTKKSGLPFQMMPCAVEAFRHLRRLFTTAPILQLPDVELPFVDASELGVGAVLSQRSSRDRKLHPCIYLSNCLSPAERNYRAEDRELLTIKAALEKWRHWLEGGQPSCHRLDRSSQSGVC